MKNETWAARVANVVRIVDALPMNATGKVTKFVLRDRARASGRSL